MKAKITNDHNTYIVDLSKPLDISLSLRGDDKNPVAWYLGHPRIFPVRDGDFVGKVSEGASTNFNNVQFNPHAHGTHTECVGHITREFYSINDSLKTFFFTARLISLEPEKRGEDLVITEEQIKRDLRKNEVEAFIIRTHPNYIDKRSKKYSHTNWPYLEEKAAKYIKDCGIKHLLIDLPSVDKEKDEGKLLAHKAFWDYPKNTRFDATITELIYVPNKIEDGDYILNLQAASFENDAAPSRPVLYKPENDM
ncbi:cyclase family protein [Antarcticibacterium arcticum]|uniref:Cyclase family protein n=1 Tax=Antarcticibacterium arcticum TaxID=2585771 RepID=A0A5B8YMR6_9FLAO|nr:cyclase family protein [Antarcticibacterium arcticum]QED38801.1 cyclase family protein [Antarcticibacterium arcticum]